MIELTKENKSYFINTLKKVIEYIYNFKDMYKHTCDIKISLSDTLNTYVIIVNISYQLNKNSFGCFYNHFRFFGNLATLANCELSYLYNDGSSKTMYLDQNELNNLLCIQDNIKEMFKGFNND